MRKGKELIGMPVVVSQSGVEIERVEGLILDPTETHVNALLVDSDDWSRQARVLSLCDVQSFGATEIAVTSANVIHDVVQIPDIRRLLNRDVALAGTRLVEYDGTEVGTVNDIFFDEDTGDIDSFQFSNGSMANTRVGCRILPLYDELANDVIVHTSEVKQLAERKSPFAVSKSSKQVFQWASGDGPQGRHQVDRIGSRSLNSSGELVPLSGMLIRPMLRNIWKAFQRRILSISTMAFRSVEEFRIRRALGRRVRYPIIDACGSIIVNKDEIVTHALINRAREAKVLGDLFCAVDRRVAAIKPKRAVESSQFRSAE